MEIEFEELKLLFQTLKNQKERLNKDFESGDAVTKDKYLYSFNPLIARLDHFLQETPKTDEKYVKLICMKSSLLYEHTKISMNADKLETSLKLIEDALGLIEEYKNCPTVTFLHMRLINHYAYLTSKQGEYEKALNILESTLEENEPKHNMLVYCTEELFCNTNISQSSATSKINKLVANNLQMLGWIYGKLGMPDVHANKQHLALRRVSQSKDCDFTEWSFRCIRLAALFCSRCRWISARYHLKAVEAILNTNKIDCEEDRRTVIATLGRGWISYGLHLFSNSKNPSINPQEEELRKENDIIDKELTFPALEAINVSEVPASLITTNEEARSLFLHSQKWLKITQHYFPLVDFPVDHVNIILDWSELYRFLAFYEADLDSQYNVQKKRADTLEILSAILRENRPQCYLAVSVELLRELAAVQIEMIEINLKRVSLAASGDEARLKHGMSAMMELHSKLGGVGDMLEQDGEQREQSDNLTTK